MINMHLNCSETSHANYHILCSLVDMKTVKYAVLRSKAPYP